jgi:Fe-S-cluster containining protein
MSDRSGPTAAEDELYADSVDGVAQRLEDQTQPAELLAALRWGMVRLNEVYSRIPERITAQAACRAGCDFCCRVPLGVQAHEVFLAADRVLRTFSPEEIAGVRDRAKAHYDRVQAAGSDGYHALMQPCPLLRDRKCSIYGDRPEICRSHHSRDAAVCEAYLADQTVDLESAYIPPIRRRLFAVMLGNDEAFSAAGFDDRAYDFGCALHEALTDDFCLARWSRREPAFSPSCHEPE